MKSLFLLMFLMMKCASAEAFSCDLDKRIEILQKKVKECQHVLDTGSLKDIETIKKHLSIMASLDQEGRILLLGDFTDPKLNTLIEEIDSFHTNHLKAILAIHPWITISKFGKEADHHAWLLVQHADQDSVFQIRILSILEKLLPSHETDKKNYAYLYDRVAPKIDKKQRYGTQAKIEGDHVNLLPFEGSLEDVNKRRKALGLCPLKEYIETLKKVYKKDG